MTVPDGQVTRVLELSPAWGSWLALASQLSRIVDQHMRAFRVGGCHPLRGYRRALSGSATSAVRPRSSAHKPLVESGYRLKSTTALEQNL
jgi:hypothetical protein